STITLGDINIHFVDEGTGPAVLLCHGFPETWYSWRHQIKSLAASGYRVIAPDLRGFGGSSSPQNIQRFNIVEIVGDLVGLIQKLGL
ncbi:alpha/beta fold hydrolase, partial [Acinetobacter baumannii]